MGLWDCLVLWNVLWDGRGKTRLRLHSQVGKVQTLLSLPCAPRCLRATAMARAGAVCRAVNTHGTGEPGYRDLGHCPIPQQGCLPDQSPAATCLQIKHVWATSIANHYSSQTMTLKINKTLTPSFFNQYYLVTFNPHWCSSSLPATKHLQQGR